MPPGDVNLAGHARLQIFQRVVDQVREGLLERKAVGDDLRQRVDVDRRVRLLGLVGDGFGDAFDQLMHVDPLGLEFAAAFAGQSEDRGDQPVHLADRRLDEAQGFVELLRKLLVRIVRAASSGAASAPAVTVCGAESLASR